MHRMPRFGFVLLSMLLVLPSAALPLAADVEPPRNPDYSALTGARRLADWEQADAVAARLSLQPEAAWVVAGYLTYDRARCDEAAKLVRTAKASALGSYSEDSLRFDIQLCLAARLDQTDPRAAEKLLGQALDSSGEFGHVPSGAFERFAEAWRPDLTILRFLRRNGFDRWPSGSSRSGLRKQVGRLDASAVATLLEAGVDPNAPLGEEAVLPLQLVRDRSVTNEAKALAVARVMVERGADPNLLAWYRGGKKHDADRGAPGSLALETFLRDAAARVDPVRVDYMGMAQVSSSDGGARDYHRVRIGNATSKPVPLLAWQAGDRLVCSMHILDGDYRPRHGSRWLHDLGLIQHGPSPEGVEIPPGESRDMLCDQSLSGPPESEYRLRLRLRDGKTRYTQPFRVELDLIRKQSVELPAFEEWR